MPKVGAQLDTKMRKLCAKPPNLVTLCAEHVGFLNKEASYILAELAAALMGLDIQPEDNQSDKRKLALHYAS